MRSPSGEEIFLEAKRLAHLPENAGKSPEELVRLAAQFLSDLERAAFDEAFRRHCESTGSITEQEAALVVTGDDHSDDALRRLTVFETFLRQPPEELTHEELQHRNEWMAHEWLPALLRIHGKGRWTNQFCWYLRDTVFPKYKLIELSVGRRRKKVDES
jgi:hypothetical protein